MTSTSISLAALKKGVRAEITSVGAHSDSKASPPDEKKIALIQRILEMGIVEGAEIEVALEAPWSHDPIAVRVRGSLIALRRSEAEWIQVRPL